MAEAPGGVFRYAIYHAPAPDSPWAEAGRRWLGRCAWQRRVVAQAPIASVAFDQLQQLTAAPRRYGWHATLKAPFRLRADGDAAVMRSALARMAALLEAVPMPRLRVDLLDDFLALVPAGDADATASVGALARTLVVGMHGFAAPLTPAELARHRGDGLTAQEDLLLRQWGYPHVMERFRLHYSLTGSLRGVDPAVVEALRDAAAKTFDRLPPSPFDAVSLFAEPAHGADFVMLEQFRLGR